MSRVNILDKIIKNINKLPNNVLLNLSKHIDYEIQVVENAEFKAKNWYSKRHEYDPVKDLDKWEFMVKETLEKSKTLQHKFSNPIFDKVYRSRFGDINPFKLYFPTNMTEIYISDYIMFNKNCVITIDLVDRILPYIKFKKNDDDSYQLDRWLFEEKGFYNEGSNEPNYTIKYLEEDTIDIDYVKNEEEKRLIVRAMLQIMNETPNEYLNFNSYQVIGNWYSKYDNWLSSWVPNTQQYFNEKNINPLKAEELIIDLNGRLEINTLVEILYSCAEYGGDDLNKTSIKYNNKFTNIIDSVLHQYNKSFKSGDYIKKISDATINTKLDYNQIDLNNYLTLNGEERTRNVIDKINHAVNYKYNFNNVIKTDGSKITKSELLCAMYNTRLPYGMGWIEAIEKFKSDDKYQTLEPKEAKKILIEKKDYIDYLFGVPIKTSFKSFPIIDYRKYNGYDNDGLNKCIKYLKDM